jgi:hypothetical protein
MSYVGINIKHDTEEIPVYPVLRSISTASELMPIRKKSKAIPVTGCGDP